jgi:hypothetical protein
MEGHATSERTLPAATACLVVFTNVGTAPSCSWVSKMPPDITAIELEARRRATIRRFGPMEVEYDWRTNRGRLVVRGEVVGRFSLKPIKEHP